MEELGVVWGRGVLRIVYVALSIGQRRGGRVGGTACTAGSGRARHVTLRLYSLLNRGRASALVSRTGNYVQFDISTLSSDRGLSCSAVSISNHV